MKFLPPLFILLSLIILPLSKAADWVWIEGESAQETNIRPHPWYAGEIKKELLSGGAFIAHFVFDSRNSHHGAIDCFAFTLSPFEPAGTAKPDEVEDRLRAIASENAGWFPWNPAPDPFLPSPMDLRPLNEKYAGENGRIVAKDGDFIHEKSGQPVRFWAVNGPPNELKGEELHRCARLLAKHGVNLVRLHGAVFDEKTGAFKPDSVEEKQRILSAMKKEGIYSMLSIYFPLWMKPENGTGWREGYNGEQHPFALIFFEPEFQQLYRSWWKELLTSPAADGTKLIDDPALMALEIVNEDSLFFWTFSYDKIPEAQMQKLETLFGTWAAKKYGSIDKALAAWSATGHLRDKSESGRLGFRTLYDMTHQKTKRDQDTAAFLFETQHEFYTQTVNYLRELGYKGLITASNWITANNEILGPLEKYSYTPGDFIDRHGYFGSNHKGENAAWSIREGHTYSDRSALRFDPESPGKSKSFNHPAMDPHFNGMPSMLSETAWNRPNRYRGEAPIYYAVYGALQGSDAIVHFALDGDRWSPKPRFFMQPWTLMSPTQMGQFPATALIYRLGLVRKGEVMADLPVKLSEALQLKGSRLMQRANLDELRKSDLPEHGEAAGSELGMDPLVHYVGQTKVRIGDSPAPGKIEDLAPFINRKTQQIASSTGELQLDYGKGGLAIRAPRTQGLSGHLSSMGKIDLGDVVMESDLELGHILVVALDGRPIASSARLLIQAMTEEKPAGFATETAGSGTLRITRLGGDPWLFREIRASLQFKRADAASLVVTALDKNGYPMENEKPTNAVKIQLKPDTVYYLVIKP